jgi:CHAT domain-containing protein
MRTHTLVSILIIGVLLIVSPILPAEAQRGMGQGRGRPTEPASPGKSPEAGTYSLNGPDIIDVVNRGDGPRALAYYERSQTTLSKGRTRALVDEEVRLRTRLAEAKAHTQDSGELADSEPPQALIEALDQDYRAFLDRVRKENLEQASLMTVEPVTLSEIQALLPAGTTLLEYVVADRGLIIWAVDRQRFKVVRVPGDRQSLVAQVRQFRTAITGLADLKDVQTQAEALHRRLLGPVRADIHGTRLLIVPHGVLHYLPFAALRSPDGHWVIEDFAMSTLPSASVLRYLEAKGTGAPPRALVVGNPDLGAALALPWAEREARMVGERERDATVLVRGDATEAQAKKLLLHAGLVHLATHGELNESDPLGSALLMVPGGGEDGRWRCARCSPWTCAHASAMALIRRSGAKCETLLADPRVRGTPISECDPPTSD